MSTHHVKVQYSYRNGRGGASATRVSWSGNVLGNTESIVLAELRKRHPGADIVMHRLEWR